MKVKFLKTVIDKSSPLIDKTLPAFECLILNEGSIGFDAFDIQARWKCDCNTVGEINWQEIKKLIKSLDPTDDINFEKDINYRILVSVNGTVIGSFMRALEDISNRIVPFDLNVPQDYDYEFLHKDDFDSMKIALGFAGKDELRPAMMGLSLSERVVSTNANCLYFKELQSKFKKNISYNQSWPSFEKVDDVKVFIPKNGGTLEMIEKEEREVYETTSPMLIRSKHISFLISLGTQSFRVARKKGKMYLDPVAGLFPYQYDTLVKFQTPECVIILKPIDEKFPDVDSVIPRSVQMNAELADQNQIDLEFNTKELIKWLKVALSFANEITHRVSFSIKDQSILLEAEDIDNNKEFSKEIGVKRFVHVFKENEKICERIGFNASILISILEKTNTLTVTMNIWAENRGAIINDSFLIMPVMLNSYATA